MPRDNKSSKLSKESVKKSKKSDELARRKKTILSSDSDDNASSDSENENENEMDVHEYRKFLSKIFPSKNLDKKIKAGEKLKEIIESEEEEWEDDEYDSDTDTDSDSYTDGEEVKNGYNPLGTGKMENPPITTTTLEQ